MLEVSPLPPLPSPSCFRCNKGNNTRHHKVTIPGERVRGCPSEMGSPPLTWLGKIMGKCSYWPEAVVVRPKTKNPKKWSNFHEVLGPPPRERWSSLWQKTEGATTAEFGTRLIPFSHGGRREPFSPPLPSAPVSSQREAGYLLSDNYGDWGAVVHKSVSKEGEERGREIAGRPVDGAIHTVLQKLSKLGWEQPD